MTRFLLRIPFKSYRMYVYNCIMNVQLWQDNNIVQIQESTGFCLHFIANIQQVFLLTTDVYGKVMLQTFIWKVLMQIF